MKRIEKIYYNSDNRNYKLLSFTFAWYPSCNSMILLNSNFSNLSEFEVLGK